MKTFIKILLSSFLALGTALAFAAAVDVNKASQAELESVKGIGPAMSTRILDARKSGAFKDWSDLAGRVKGIGAGNAAKFSADGMTVNGASFTAGSPAAGTVAKADAAARARK